MFAQYDDFANRLTASYELFLMALRGAYLTVLTSNYSKLEAGVEFDKLAYKLAENFVVAAKKEIIENGGVSSENPRIEPAVSFLVGSVLQNITQVRDQLTKGTVAEAFSGGLKGAMMLLYRKQKEQIDFKLRDTSNREWQAEKLFRTVLRDFAYQSYVDNIVFSAFALGKKNFIARKSDGTRIAFTAENFESIRGTVFHVNSNTVVESV